MQPGTLFVLLFEKESENEHIDCLLSLSELLLCQ